MSSTLLIADPECFAGQTRGPRERSTRADRKGGRRSANSGGGHGLSTRAPGSGSKSLRPGRSRSDALFLHGENGVTVLPRLQAAIGRLRVPELRLTWASPKRQALIDKDLALIDQH